MTDLRWQRVKDLFHEAALQAPEARATFLDAACQGDAELRHEVESLLDARDEAGAFLSVRGGRRRRSSSSAEPAVPEGRQIGPYRIQDLIGQGGMGTVYRAVRDDDAFRKTVALKLMRGGAASADAGAPVPPGAPDPGPPPAPSHRRPSSTGAPPTRGSPTS